jgi:uncharacterized damage-inducible protein DinB
MTLVKVATHIAELPTWVSKPFNVKNSKELMEHFEKSLSEGKAHLTNATDEELLPNWTLRNGDEIYSTSSKAEVIRMAYCQIVHHRAQMGVYLRLLDIPIPGSYGPSTDDPTM